MIRSKSMGLAVAIFLAACFSAQAQTKRTAKVRILNQSNQDIYNVTVFHKYSDVYKDSYTWKQVRRGTASPANMQARYNTGAFTTGKDWWIVTWSVANNNNSIVQYTTDPQNFRNVIDGLEQGAQIGIPIATNVLSIASVGLSPAAGLAVAGGSIIANELAARTMNNESTAGFKQHILRDEDKNKITEIRIKSDGRVIFRSKSGRSETMTSRQTVRFSVPSNDNNNGGGSGGVVDGYSVKNVRAGNNQGQLVTTFKMVGNKKWQEIGSNNQRFNFTEQNRDKWSVYLYDRARNVSIQLDLYTKQVKYAPGNGQKKPIYKIIGSSK